MKKVTSLLVITAAGLGVVQLSACGGSQPEPAASEPADVTPVKGTDVSDVKLTAQAARRVGIRTVPVAAVTVHSRGRNRVEKTIPYSAVLYEADGKTYAYTNPRPLVYRRALIRVADIRGGRALLTAGPPVGTAVVSVGAPELFGTEFGVEE